MSVHKWAIGTRMAWDFNRASDLLNGWPLRERPSPKNLWDRVMVIGYAKGKIDLAHYSFDPRKHVGSEEPPTVDDVYSSYLCVPLEVFDQLSVEENWRFAGEPDATHG